MPTDTASVITEAAGHLTALVQTRSFVEWSILLIQLGYLTKIGTQLGPGFSLRLLAEMFFFTRI